MFYHIYGELVHRERNFAVIDCGGVGYKMTISRNTAATLDKLSADGTKVKLFTHMSVREDAVELFGFHSMEELETFKLLTGVSGVGPKAAISILSEFTPDGLSSVVYAEDTKAISKANGVGGKTAARIVLELKGKLTNFGDGAKKSAATGEYARPSGTKVSEAADALTALGFGRGEVNQVLASIDTTNLDTGEIVRLALKKRSEIL